MMEDYALLTVNTSRIGQNAIEKIDSKIMEFNVTKIIKRSEPASALAIPTITAAPVLDERGIDDIFDDITGGIGSFTSDVGAGITSARSEIKSKATSARSAVESKATAAASAIESKASSIEAAVASKIISAVHTVQTSVASSINNTYLDALHDLNFKDFYSIHLRTTCVGEYITPTGDNITIGISPAPPNGTHGEIQKCKEHSSLNPLILIRVFYYLGAIFTGVALLTTILGLVRFSRKVAILNIMTTAVALCFLVLGSALSHGFAIAAAGLIDFISNGIGVDAKAGRKFIALTWATTILVAISCGLWVVLALLGKRLPRGGKRVPSAGSDKNSGHEMYITRPQLVHSSL
jgi:hypothetical protein